jgi:hypothetical protein
LLDTISEEPIPLFSNVCFEVARQSKVDYFIPNYKLLRVSLGTPTVMVSSCSHVYGIGGVSEDNFNKQNLSLSCRPLAHDVADMPKYIWRRLSVAHLV